MVAKGPMCPCFKHATLRECAHASCGMSEGRLHHSGGGPYLCGGDRCPWDRRQCNASECGCTNTPPCDSHAEALLDCPRGSGGSRRSSWPWSSASPQGSTPTSRQVWNEGETCLLTDVGRDARADDARLIKGEIFKARFQVTAVSCGWRPHTSHHFSHL